MSGVDHLKVLNQCQVNDKLMPKELERWQWSQFSPSQDEHEQKCKLKYKTQACGHTEVCKHTELSQVDEHTNDCAWPAKAHNPFANILASLLAHVTGTCMPVHAEHMKGYDNGPLPLPPSLLFYAHKDIFTHQTSLACPNKYKVILSIYFNF